MSSDGGYLLAVDAGSSQISVPRRIQPGGALARVGNPVSSGGVEPVSIAVHQSDPLPGVGGDQDLVYVANAGNGGSNYTGFTLSPRGRLTPSPARPSLCPMDPCLVTCSSAEMDPIWPGPVSTRRSSTASLSLATGSLTAAANSPFPAEGLVHCNEFTEPPPAASCPTAHGGAQRDRLGVPSLRQGTLTSIARRPTRTGQTAPCWVEITHDGRFLFTVNTAVPSISRYSIAPNGSLTLRGSTVFNDPTGLGPEDARLAPDGATLWVVDTGANTVSGFAVRGGHLSELPSSPTALPGGSTPFGIVVS